MPVARAMVVWMVGEYNSIGQIIPKMLGTILQYLARCFISEAVETKNQILCTTVKVFTGLTNVQINHILLYPIYLSLLCGLFNGGTVS